MAIDYVPEVQVAAASPCFRYLGAEKQFVVVVCLCGISNSKAERKEKENQEAKFEVSARLETCTSRYHSLKFPQNYVWGQLERQSRIEQLSK